MAENANTNQEPEENKKYLTAMDRRYSSYRWGREFDSTSTSNNSNGEEATIPSAATDELSQSEILHNVNHNSIYRSNNLYLPREMDLFNRRYRFGVNTAYQALTNCREYLFFTKPDMNIMYRGNDGIIQDRLTEQLKPIPYWNELVVKYPEIISSLQSSYNYNGSIDNPFINLLGNMVNSTLTIPSCEADVVDNPVNTYGVGYTYRGSSEKSNNGYQFSLRFKDTKYLPVYNFFKAYDDYEILKHHGTIYPWLWYNRYRILDDQYSIYKFIVDEDCETIIYYAKLYGVYSKNVPRDVFTNTMFDNGLEYDVDFQAAFIEDMNPQILGDFNRLSYNYYKKMNFAMDVWNPIYDRIDNRPAEAAIVVLESDGSYDDTIPGISKSDTKDENGLYENFSYDDVYIHSVKNAPGNFVYKLKWRGNDIE